MTCLSGFRLGVQYENPRDSGFRIPQWRNPGCGGLACGSLATLAGLSAGTHPTIPATWHVHNTPNSHLVNRSPRRKSPDEHKQTRGNGDLVLQGQLVRETQCYVGTVRAWGV